MRAGLCALLAVAGGCGPPPPPPAPPSPPPAAPPEEGPTTWFEAGPSFLPNLGVEVGVGRTSGGGTTVRRSLELHGAWQFLDDEDFADDGNPKAGPWYQLRAGVRWAFSPGARRRLVTRLGGIWLRAEGEPNVIQEGGDYLGVYGGVGFETDLTATLSVGPELTILGVTRTSKLSVARPVPQINWHATVRPGRVSTGEARAGGPPGSELYAGATGLASPGLGGGVVVGQVFRRGAGATWAVEVAGGLQAPRNALFFHEDGRWAQAQVGVKGSLDPGARGHWTGRGGAIWLRSTAANRFLDVESDHVGAYLGLGWEYDLSEHLTTGPELRLLLVSHEQEVAFRLVPQLRWHVLVGS